MFGGSMVMGIIHQNLPLWKPVSWYGNLRSLWEDLEKLGAWEMSFFMWLVVRERCWTADQLARRGLPHPSYCPLCDQEVENINHLLSTRVFTREFWFFLLCRVGLQSHSPIWWDLLWWLVGQKLKEGDLLGWLVERQLKEGAWSLKKVSQFHHPLRGLDIVESS